MKIHGSRASITAPNPPLSFPVFAGREAAPERPKRKSARIAEELREAAPIKQTARIENIPAMQNVALLLRPTGLISRAWRWIRERQTARSSPRRLQVAATASLGEKRFVAVIQVDGRQFLIGGGPTNIALLAQLSDNESFSERLQETMAAAKEAPLRKTVKPAAKPAAKQVRKQA
jgi:flagellar biogenesis protein FliO